MTADAEREAEGQRGRERAAREIVNAICADVMAGISARGGYEIKFNDTTWVEKIAAALTATHEAVERKWRDWATEHVVDARKRAESAERRVSTLEYELEEADKDREASNQTVVELRRALALAREALEAEGHSSLCGVIVGDSTLCSKCRALLAPNDKETTNG
jgi:hypothetical protein